MPVVTQRRCEAHKLPDGEPSRRDSCADGRRVKRGTHRSRPHSRRSLTLVCIARMRKEVHIVNKRQAGRSSSAIRRTVTCAVFAALAYALMLVFHFKVQFLTFDLKDAVITIAGLILGPVAALVISLLVAVIEMITVSDTQLYGFIMNFASSATFSVVAALVYRFRKKLSGAICGLSAAIVAVVSVMMLLNLLVTPFYTGMTTESVASMIPTLLLPFNTVKALTNAALVLILYKPVSRAVIAARLLPRPTPPSGESAPTHHRPVWYSIAVTVGGLLLLTVAILLFFFVLDGDIQFFLTKS